MNNPSADAGDFDDTEDLNDNMAHRGSHQSTDVTSSNQEQTDRASILLQYKKLRSRRVDLVGDYAGRELFLIDGDSLLLRCFTENDLDLTQGLQLLHATYNVESFLQHLIQRKCSFHIVFFESNKRLCVPPNVDKVYTGRYLLTRAAIIRHLKCNLAAVHPQIVLSTFQSYFDPKFETYMKATSPYFVMAHDGAVSIDAQTENDEENQFAASEASVLLRNMALAFVHRGVNVALINEVEWRDTKVMAVVLELEKRASAIEIAPKVESQYEQEKLSGIPEDLEFLREEYAQLSERQILAVVTVSQLLRKSSTTEGARTSAELCSKFLLHQVVLQHLPLANRRVTTSSYNDNLDNFLNTVSNSSASILTNESWSSILDGTDIPCDVADFVDGRLFVAIASGTATNFSTGIISSFEQLQEAVNDLCGTDVSLSIPDHITSESDGQKSDAPVGSRNQKDSMTVLPFSNAVFDKHLEIVRIKVDAHPPDRQSLESRKIFKEVSHWHNARRPIGQKSNAPVLTAYQAMRAARRDQLFMAEMRTYAASLTNSVGKSLEPETIIVGSTNRRGESELQAQMDSSQASDTSTATNRKGQKGKTAGGSKTDKLNASKAARFAQIAAEQTKRIDATDRRIIDAWHKVCEGIELKSDPETRYAEAFLYHNNLKPASKAVVGTECELYMISCLVNIWVEDCKRSQKDRHLHVLATIWHHARSICSSPTLPKSVLKGVFHVVDMLMLPAVPKLSEAIQDRKLTFALPIKPENSSLQSGMEPTMLQLLHCGPYLERSFNSAVDPRVDFKPDEWQRRVLDTIDADQSVFVVAPTSAGKTFISFYAMRQVLATSDDGVLVYVAPTKALVNQIAAEIQARYSKSFKHGGKSVWAIHTRDYRINDPTGCQVLVTVPHILQIMLLSPSNCRSWSSRVKRIIFDEVHSIGEAESGIVLEQLLLMAPCPIIALSATVGNPGEFSEWLSSTQEAMGGKLVNITHPHRYSDLRKYTHDPPKAFSFTGLSRKAMFNQLGLDGVQGMKYIHPVTALVDKTRGIPEDLALEARDCLLLWQAMVKVQTPEYSVPSKLDPKHLPEVLRKTDILAWEKDLKVLLLQWLSNNASPFDELLKELASDGGDALEVEADGENDEPFIKTTLSLLCRLHDRDALPAILFNYDRSQCEEVCQTILQDLKEAETNYVKNNSAWQKKLERWADWKDQKDKAGKGSKGAAKTSKKKGKAGDGDDETASKLDQQREAGSAEADKWDSFDPNAPIDGYHFADYSKAQASELALYARQLERRGVDSWLIEALGRGIGVHHAGMNRKYRQVVEILFRKRFLQVVVATGTLALGINMPCKTVAFLGDSVFLTALNYRQCAGRAGRRGFDLLGNVVFHGISHAKVQRLISSRLPDLNGHFPITTTLVLRLFSLLHESNNSDYAVGAINALLSQPRLYLGGESFKHQTMHHLRFSIEYLRRQQLLGSDGAPLNFAGLVSHLYFTENSSFAFHALLKEGYFNNLCADIHTDEEGTLLTLMLVLAHLFNRIPCRHVDTEYREVVKPSSSMVFLPSLPKKAAAILKQHNKETLQVYKTYVQTFIDQHIDYKDNKLPLTGRTFGGEDAKAASGVPLLAPTQIRSLFVSLSGADDSFDSIHDLCSTVRSGVFLEEAVIPYMAMHPQDSNVPLNAWLLDFFKHGDVKTLEKANGIRKSEIWFILNDFSLVLATIVTSLTNFLKAKRGNDMDMIDVKGGGDVYEENLDDQIAAMTEQQSQDATTEMESTQSKSKPMKTIKKKAKVVDSWDADDSDDATGEEDGDGSSDADSLEGELAAWNIEEGGLHNVLKSFQTLQQQFNEKFRAMWA